MRALVELGAEVNARDEDRRTPLHYAARANQADTVWLLVDLGGDMQAEDKEGCTPAEEALGKG